MAAQPKKRFPERTSSKTSEPISNPQEQIRRRPYELYELRGRQDGHDLDDWLQSESELRLNGGTTAAA